MGGGSSSKDTSEAPQLITQIEVDYLVAVLGLSQLASMFLTMFVKRRKLTHKNVNSTPYRLRHRDFRDFFTENAQKTFTFCTDVKGLVNAMGDELHCQGVEIIY